MSALNRRAAIKGVLTSVAVPAVVSGCAISPAAAAICKTAPSVPGRLSVGVDSSLDAKLFDLCAQFHRADEAEAKAFERYCCLPEGSEQAKAADAEFDARYEVWAALADACYATAPQTAGAAALLDVIFTRDSEYIDEVVQKPLKLIRDCLKAMVSS